MDAVAQFLKECEPIPRLDDAEIRRLLAEKSLGARDTLIRAFAPLIVMSAQRWHGTMPVIDAIMVGAGAAIRVIDAKGTKIVNLPELLKVVVDRAIKRDAAKTCNARMATFPGQSPSGFGEKCSPRPFTNPPGTEPSWCMEAFSNDPEPQEAAEADERRHSVLESLRLFSLRTRVVLLSRYYGNLSHGDIATVLGISRQRVWQIQTRAERRLKRMGELDKWQE